MSPDASYTPTRTASPPPAASLKSGPPAVHEEHSGSTRQSSTAESFGFDSSPDLKALCTPPYFKGDFEKERRYLKEKLAAALRIFAREGMDHHVVCPVVLPSSRCFIPDRRSSHRTAPSIFFFPLHPLRLEQAGHLTVRDPEP
ncbi:hypothetical protein JCM11251_000145 [Rhodosporidiobolus azoricus]